MRTLRKALCILCLAVLVASSAAWAAPAERSGDDPSIVSWVLSMLESVATFMTPDGNGGAVDRGAISASSEATTADEMAGVYEPGGPTAGLEGQDPPGDEVGAVIDPHG